ncbi:hypothetical protein Zmor_007294 [Zophobas morio]|uniref:Uncharacterized protein n=1 Tax=Zophobas morio TaxID=2755281 RepID=A0AA38IVF7_9CUCU|nr:hypothetical protein Zmor_007294 [Zophobas morio]
MIWRHPPLGLRVRPGPGERAERRRVLQRGPRPPPRFTAIAAASAVHATASQHLLAQRVRLARRLSWSRGQRAAAEPPAAAGRRLGGRTRHAALHRKWLTRDRTRPETHELSDGSGPNSSHHVPGGG